MIIRVQVAGPLFDAALSRRVFEAELRQGSEEALGLLKTRANQTVHRDRGEYERGWQPVRFRYGGRQVLEAILENTAQHAATQEDGRGANKRPPPVDAIEAWTIRKGIRPRGKDTPAARRSMAIAMSRAIGLKGWPNEGSVGYLGPPAPVATAIDREQARVQAAFDRVGARIARRLG
jgi:hypothetical protein